MMWYRVNENEVYVLSKVNDTLCIEYCTEYCDMKAGILFVPDSLNKKFKEEFDCEYRE